MPRPVTPKAALNPTLPPERYRTKATSSTGRGERTFSASALAIMLDVDRGTVKRWIDARSPIAAEPQGKGGSYTLDLADVVKWLMGKAAGDAAASAPDPADGPALPPGYETKDEADRRRAIALANIAEIEEAKAAGTVVPIDMMADLFTAEVAKARSKLEGVGSTLAGRTARITDAGKIQEVADWLIAEVAECLAGDLSPLFGTGVDGEDG